jgi:hypothetical protein
MKKYVINVMNHLFTKKEIQEGYIIEGPSTSKSNKLDESRVELLKSKTLF